MKLPHQTRIKFACARLPPVWRALMGGVRAGSSCAALGAMRSYLLLFCLFIEPVHSADDMSWLEREWISDVDLTVAANPAYERMDAERQKGFRSLFGKTRWRFHDGFFESKTAQGAYSYPYFIRP